MKIQSLKKHTMNSQGSHERKERNLRVSFIIGCLLLFSGCRTDLYLRGEQCSPVFVYSDESRRTIDSELSYCNVRQYEFGRHHVGPIQGTEYKEVIQYCDRCVGFKNYAETATFWEEVRREINNERSTKKERVPGKASEPVRASED